MALFSALFSILLIQISNAFLKAKIGQALPVENDLLTIGLASTLTCAIACLFIKWRLRASFLASGCSAILIIVAHFCSSTFTPVLSKQLMPEGPRFAEIGNHTKSELRRIVDEAIQKEEETGTPSLIAKLGKSFDGLKKITSKEESESIGRDFKAGMKFIQERRALMAAMSEEEKNAYRANLAAFKKENDIQNDPYSAESLARLKNIKGMEGIGSKLEAAALMKESLTGTTAAAPAQTKNLRQAESMSLDELGDMMGALTAGLSSVDTPSLEDGVGSHGNELPEVGQMLGTLSGVASIMDASPTDLSAIDPQALTGLAGSTSAPILDIDRPQHQNFMAKDSQPELNYFSEQGPVTNPLTSIDGNEAALPQPEPILEIAQSEHEEVQDEPVEPA
ncbi:MAG: hypothetical protein AAGC73_09435, partial [Verrucomicrobiota bacterium]